MKTIKRIKKRKSLIRFIAMFVAAVLVFELMPYLSDHAELTAEAAQTLSEFEQSRWNSILGATFNEYTVTGNATPTPSSMISAYTVKNDSPYFHWHETSNDVPTWGSTTVTTVGSTQEQITYATDTVENGAGGSPITANAVPVTYKTYHVKNADEFVWVMYRANTVNTRIILDKDIDMGGASGRKWSETITLSGNSWFDLEGNGHTIYNFRMTKPLINSSESNKKTIIRNVLFTNCLAFFANNYQGIVIGVIKSPVHLENVSVTDSLVYSDSQNIGILIGRVDGYTGGNIFLENCSTLRSYIYGTSHIGGMTACQYNTGTYKVKYNAEFPKSPEAWMGKGVAVFPEMVENCYSVDCEVFSNGEDSGAILSCGDGFICRNCFTNNTMYGNKKTGAYIGRVVTQSSPNASLYDDGYGRTLNESFINCFSSGSVEGSGEIGGFVALQHSSNNVNSGACVYINCYSTAMVGMEFAGTQLGGFIGHEDTYKKDKQKPSVTLPDGTQSTNYGDVYINCYAAGEVGNILTDTSTQATGNSLGGFLGNVSTSGNGTYYNCYYDKQTTAMRERACGVQNNFSVGNSQIPGVTGVYTQKSTAKNVKGLADNVRMSNDYTTWEYQNGFYPMLKVFIANDAFNTLFDDTRSKLVEEYARASVATVLLNHYDTILEDNGEERDATSSDEDKKAYDTVRDITSKFELTTNDTLGITWGKDEEKNTSRGLKYKFGGDDGFTLEYTTVKQDENGAYLTGTENESKITKTFTPDVLTIGRYDDPEDTTRGYYYKCFDFAPGIQWLKVSAGDIENNVTGWDNNTNPTYTDTNLVGSRSFRLLPTAYLNAGDIMHINVETDNTTSPVTYTNTVTIAQGADENKINGLFNHSVGVAFAITDKYRMGTDNIYTRQSIQKYDGKTGLINNQEFAFYSGYAVNNTNTENTITNVMNAKNIGSDAMVSQKFDIKNNYSSSAITNNSSNGTVRVRIFRANAKEIGAGKGFYLEKGTEINYSDQDTLAKWQGEKPFDTNDSNAYYYLDYYWRLNDGRYLFDRKLVRITADTYSVTMKTGLLDEQYTVNESVTPKTAVDQYVTDNITTNSDNKKTWDKNNLYPSKNVDFNAQTAPNYYEPDTYNKFEYINGNDYYTKTLKIDTARPQTAVGWMRASDYKLTALIVEAVDSNGIHHEMSRIDANNANDPLNFDNAEYTYDYKTYSVTQDSETKIFSVTENTTVTNTFSVETHSSEVTNGVSKFILFSFSTTGDVSQGFSEIKDSLIITALFRKNDANVKTEKQVLANTGDPITAVSDTIKTSTYDNNGVTQTQTYYSSIDVIDENKRVDDKGISDTDKRKAVLSGDTLTYRLKAYNAGYFTSREVNIYDDIPSGTTYVENSAKLYRQKSLSTSNFDRYDKLTEIQSGSGYNINYDPTSKRISADIPNIALDENYYLEYKVKVDDIKATDLSETITNKANYQFINFNGDTTDDFNDTNQNAAQANAIVSMNVKHNENDQEYVVDFQGNEMDSSKTYTIDSYTNVFPENFTFQEDSVKVYNTSEEDITNNVKIEYTNDENNKKTSFTIKNKNDEAPAIVLEQNKTYQVKFKGTATPLTDSSQEIRNKATVTYSEKGEGEVAQTKATAISIVERLTNQTETDVTHLYVDIDKIIPESDPAQTFLFKIERFDKDDMSDTPEISYTKINCTTKQTEDNYTGSRLLQLDKRGYYRITEVDDWSNSDYLFDEITCTDISKVSGLTDSKTISTQNQSAVIQLPRQYNKDSLAFPTSFGGLQTGSYPILKFTNKLNDYAYRTSQAYAENLITITTP